MSRLAKISYGLLLFTLVSLLAPQANAGCALHDHDCRFHGIGRAVNDTIDVNSPTAVYIVTEQVAGPSGVTEPIDFDNNLLLPEGVGPHIVSSTGFEPDGNRNEPYIGLDEQNRHVYPSQFQNDFQNGTAQAYHSGDFNGGETVPNAPGCVFGINNCEEVVIQGNIPYPESQDAFVVKQINHLYNYHEVPDAKIDVQSYGIATGRAFFVNDTHLSVEVDTVLDDPNNPLHGQALNLEATRPIQQSLSGTGDQGEELTYYIGYYDFDPHAAGVVHHHDQKRLANKELLQGISYGLLDNGIYKYSVDQIRYTHEIYDKTYDFTEFVYEDTQLPAPHITETVTQQYTTHSDPFNYNETQQYKAYQADLAAQLAALEAKDKTTSFHFITSVDDNPYEGLSLGRIQYTQDCLNGDSRLKCFDAKLALLGENTRETIPNVYIESTDNNLGGSAGLKVVFDPITGDLATTVSFGGGVPSNKNLGIGIQTTFPTEGRSVSGETGFAIRKGYVPYGSTVYFEGQQNAPVFGTSVTYSSLKYGITSEGKSFGLDLGRGYPITAQTTLDYTIHTNIYRK